MSTAGISWGRRARRWTFRLVFAVSLSVALFAYGLPLWYHVHGQRILVVTSGSMERQPGQPVQPGQFNTGDAVVITTIAPTELRTGQVVTFWDAGHSTLTTHRIIDLVEREDLENGKDLGTTTRYIRTKGDSNGSPDPDLTPVANVRGAVADVKPGWGYFLGYAHSPLGRFLVFAPPLILLLTAELLSWRRRPAAGASARDGKEQRDAVASPA